MYVGFPIKWVEVFNLYSILSKVLRIQSMEIISSIYKFMKEEADKKIVTILLLKAYERTAVTTGISECIVTKVVDLKKLNTSENDEMKYFSAPNKC